MRTSLPALIIVAWYSLLPGQDIVRGPFRLVVEARPSARPSMHMQLIGPDSSTLFQIDRTCAEDAALPRCELFSNGTVMLVDAFAGVYELYGSNGRMMDRIALDGKVHPDHERVVMVNGNGTIVALLISDPDHQDCRLLILDGTGSRILDQRLSGSHASGLELSSNGRMAAVGTYTWRGSLLEQSVKFFQTNGVGLSSVEHEFTGGAWGAGDSLFLVYGRKSAAVVEILTGKILSTATLARNSVVLGCIWEERIPLVMSAPPPAFRAGKWIYPGLTLTEVLTSGAVRQVQTSSFNRASLRKTSDGVEVIIDGRGMKLHQR